MATITVEKFLEVVRLSNLVASAALDNALAEIRKTASPEQLATAEHYAAGLVDSGVLTRWQCDKLLLGRHKGFFLGKYRLLGHLGTGGMSRVFLAEHVTMKRRVAIKVLPSERVNDSSYLARFKLEAQAAAALDHANIVRAFDIDNEGNNHYIVMEYVEGRDLQQLVKSGAALSAADAANYVMQAANGLAHAHAKGFVHRDIKPANLLVDPQGVVKVLDMGLAKFSDENMASLTIAHDENVLGTGDYLPPEQALNSHGVDHRADIYSLGCTLYFLLTGQPPFPEGTLTQRLMMHQTKMPPSIFNFNPKAPAPIVDLCMKMIAKKPSDRPQTAQEIADLLDAWLKKNVSGGGAAGASSRPRQPSPTAPRQLATAVRIGGGESGSSGSGVGGSGVGGSGVGSSPNQRDSSDNDLSMGDTIADTNRNTFKGRGKPRPSSDSSKARGANLQTAKQLDENPASEGGALDFINQAPRPSNTSSGATNRRGKDTKDANEGSGKSRDDSSATKSHRATSKGRASEPASAKGDPSKGAKGSGGRVAKSNAAISSPGRPQHRRGSSAPLPTWMWGVVGAALVACIVMMAIGVYWMQHNRPPAPQPPAAKGKASQAAKDGAKPDGAKADEAKAGAKADGTKADAVKADAVKADAVKADAVKAEGAKPADGAKSK